MEKINNNCYALEDFIATVLRSPISKDIMKRVLYAWGDTNEDSKTELCFGAIIQLKDKKIIYITGWNDYTGWGCQDGVSLYYDSSWFYFEKELFPTPDKIIDRFGKMDFEKIVWDEDPIDLNKWLKGEIEVDYEWLKPY